MESYISTVSQEGWIVIPKDLRRKFNLTPGTKVAWLPMGRTLVIVPLREDPVAHFAGILKPGPDALEMLREEHRAERGAARSGKH